MYKTSGKTKNKMEGRRPEGNITDPGIWGGGDEKTEKNGGGFFDGAPRPEVAVRPQTDGFDYTVL